jgi:hypothetical protein
MCPFRLFLKNQFSNPLSFHGKLGLGREGGGLYNHAICNGKNTYDK